MSVPFLYVRASGSYREIGRQIGEAARPQVEASVAFYREYFETMSGGLSFAAAERQAAAYLRFARAYTPQLVEELEGMAEGAGRPFMELFVPNCGEEFTSSEPVEGPSAPQPEGAGAAARGDTSDAGTGPATGAVVPARPPGGRQGDHCTAVAVNAGGRHVIGHNMDWYVIDVESNVVFDLTLPGGTRILTIAGVPYLPMLGMTSDGIGNVSNSLHSNDNRIGLPNVFVRRWSLEARSVGEARRRGLHHARARGTNQLFLDTTGHLVDVESSALASGETSGGEWFAHTNHYDLPQMSSREAVYHEESRTRLATARRLLADGVAGGDDPVDVIARVLRCHEPSPDDCICSHPDGTEPLGEQGQTVASMICDLDERRLYACAGTPCDNPYQVFEMA
ncbi:MAG TPA: C45 family peptidase [Thermoleophilia bacterium]|nr:C45 family peptidase [Thermoleophilia bacterium]